MTLRCLCSIKTIAVAATLVCHFLIAVCFLRLQAIYRTEFNTHAQSVTDGPSAGQKASDNYRSRPALYEGLYRHGENVSCPQCAKYFLSVDLRDHRRLGNQMFNYASLLGIAKRNNRKPVFPSYTMLYKVFNLNIRKCESLKEYGHYEIFRERSGQYDNRTEKLASVNILLDGYFQTVNYFENVEQVLRREFVFQADVLSQNAVSLKSIIPDELHSDNPTRIGLHVRRGDMATIEHFKSGVPGPSYFQRAMNYYRQKYGRVLFIVCSDDIPWCKTYIKGPDVVYSENNTAAVDLAILATCQHVIQSVGSFSWWAAWLANGTSVYYNYYKSETKLQASQRKWPHFKTDWISMY